MLHYKPINNLSTNATSKLKKRGGLGPLDPYPGSAPGEGVRSWGVEKREMEKGREMGDGVRKGEVRGLQE